MAFHGSHPLKARPIFDALSAYALNKRYSGVMETAAARLPYSDIAALAENGAPPEVTELLTTEETRALRRRARALALLGRLPEDPSGMRYPWPLV